MTMKKFKFLVFLMGVFLLCSPALAYSGKIFIYHSAVSNASLGSVNDLQITVYASSPYQDGGSNELVLNTDYTLDRNGKYQGTTDSIVIDVLSCSGSRAYVLLKGNGRYAVTSGQLGDPVGPDQVISSLTSYLTGNPAAPTITSKEPGFEVAKIEWTYSANYNYSGFEFEVSTAPGAGFDANRIGGVTEVAKSGPPVQYVIGELVDGRLLEPGETYYIRLRGKVNGFAQTFYSSYVEDSFTMQSGGAVPMTINIKRVAASGLGINSFSVPNASAAVSNGMRNGSMVQYEPSTVTSGLDLCNLINSIWGMPCVRTIGTWDRDNQIEKGVKITYSGNDISAASITNLNNAFPSLEPGRGYQVYVKPEPDADVNIQFTLQ